MKIVIAPDSFKESLSALQVADAIEAGFQEIFPRAEYRKLPVADGGEGTVQAMIDATGGRRLELQVTGPLGEPVPAFYGQLPAADGGASTAVIEMAAASGLELVPPGRRNPLLTTSRGTGELILHALDAGVRRFVLGVGGSATNDGGAGMLQALGVRFLDENGAELGPGGAELARLARIDVAALDARVEDSEFHIACDVSNPLVGPQGASAIFGPQKGATPEMTARLDACLARYAAVMAVDLGRDVADMPGAGIGGGLARDADAVHAHGISAVFAAVRRPCTVEEALAQASENLRAAARNVAQALRLGAELASVLDDPRHHTVAVLPDARDGTRT